MEEDLDEAIALLSPPFSDVSHGVISDWETDENDDDAYREFDEHDDAEGEPDPNVQYADNNNQEDVPMTDGATEAEHKDSVTGAGAPPTLEQQQAEEERQEAVWWREWEEGFRERPDEGETELGLYNAFTSLHRQQRHERSERVFAEKMATRRRFMRHSHIPGQGPAILLRHSSNPDMEARMQLIHRQTALDVLLEAWFARLGVVRKGWTWYDDKMSTRAVLELREILAKGDVELGSPAELIERRDRWEARMARVKWWFVNCSLAVDFLAAFGVGGSRFGSGQTRVEVHRFVRREDLEACVHVNHRVSMQWWAVALQQEPRAYQFPAFRPCGCVEFRLLMKMLAGAQGWPVPNADSTIKALSDAITQHWFERVRAEGLEEELGGWPTAPAVDDPPAVEMRIGGMVFSV